MKNLAYLKTPLLLFFLLIRLNAFAQPQFSIQTTDVVCKGQSTGQIQFNVTGGSGYTITYYVNGTSYNNPTITNLPAAEYQCSIYFSANTFTYTGTVPFSGYTPATINEPTNGLTATAGLLNLAGCGPLGEGTIRVTNIQGVIGTPEFSFDGGGNWTTNPQADRLPGTYAIYIKDTGGCGNYFLGNITIDPAPVAPTVTPGVIDYNCDGTANTNITVTPNSADLLSYTYYLDGVENTNTADPSIFENVPQGPHTINVKYQLDNTDYSTLLVEDFGAGSTTTSPYISGAFCYENQLGSCGGTGISDGEYSVTSNIVNLLPQGIYGNLWVPVSDHTIIKDPTSAPNGRFLVVNFGFTVPIGAVIYEQQINDIIPNQPLEIQLSAFNILNPTTDSPPIKDWPANEHGYINSDIRISLIDGSNTEIASFSTGEIPKDVNWHDYSFTLNPGNNTILQFVITSNVPPKHPDGSDVDGNEVAIDDITVYQKPTSCNQEIPIPFTVDSGKAFTASVTSADADCSGLGGEIIIQAQNFDTNYQYSTNGGANWNTTSTTPLTISGLSPNIYNVHVRYDATGACLVTSSQTIGGVSSISATSRVSELAGCGPDGKGRILVTNIQGGTPPYQFSYDNATSWTTDFEVYRDPGTYSVYIKDSSSSCEFKLQDVTIDLAPNAPTITIDAPKYNCDGSASTNVNVTSTESFEYTYYIDGVENTNADPAIFENIGVGDHTIRVTYLLESADATNLLVENFGTGAETTSPGINTTFFCFEDQQGAGSCGVDNIISDGEYSVTSNIDNLNYYDPPVDDYLWVQVDDHTSSGTDPNGRFLVVNFGNTVPIGAIIYEQQINDIIPNQLLEIQLSAFNILSPSSDSSPIKDWPANEHGYVSSDMRISLIDGGNNEIAFFSTGEIPKDVSWHDYSFTLDPGNNTSLQFIITSNVPPKHSDGSNVEGNEVAIDDITVTQKPIACPLVYEDTFTVEPSKVFTAVIDSITPTKCSDSTDGTMIITVENFDATNGFEYSIDGEITWILETNATFTVPDLSKGDLTVKLRYDSLGTCHLSLDGTIGGPAPLSVDVTSTLASCTVGGQITATPSGGTAPYTIELYDSIGTTLLNTIPSNTGVIDDIQIGVYVVRVTDANNCSFDETETVNGTAPISVTASLTTQPSCATQGVITIVPIGVSSNYTFSVSPTNPSIIYDFVSNTITGVYANTTYTVTLNDPDIGCTIVSDPVSVGGFDPLQAEAEVTELAGCGSNGEGRVRIFNIQGGLAPYEYSFDNQANWSSSDTGWVAPGDYSTSGNYIVAIKDANGCIFDLPIAVNPHVSPSVTLSALEYNCDGTANVSVEIENTTGHTFDYRYEIGGIENTNTDPKAFLNLLPNTYTITVYYKLVSTITTCEKSIDIKLTVEPNKEFKVSFVSSTLVSCSGGNDGTMTISVENFEATNGYQYSVDNTTWNTELTSPFTVSGLEEGSNTVQVRYDDTNTCSESITETISSNALVVLTATSTAQATCNLGGTITASATGGIPAYTFELLDTNLNIVNTFPSSGVLTDVSPASYFVRVTDDKNCSPSTVPVTVTGQDPLTIIPSITKLPSCDDNDGVITLATPTGGSGNYSFSINPSPTTMSFDSSTFEYSGLPSGSYVITIIDADNPSCFKDSTPVVLPVATLQPFELIPTHVSCNGESDGVITVDLLTNSPSATYFYSIDNGVPQTSNVFPDLSEKNYSVTVTSGASCILTQSVDIFQPSAIQADYTKSDVTCPNDSNGEIEISTIGGTGDYTYSISPQPSTFSIEGNIIKGLPANTYDVVVEDENGCMFSINGIEIVQPNPIEVISTIIKQELCTVDNDGSFSIDIVNGKPPYSVRLDDEINLRTVNSSTYVFDELNGGDHMVYVTDANGCEALPLPVSLDKAVRIEVLEPYIEYCTTAVNTSDNTVVINVNENYVDLNDLVFASVSNPEILPIGNVFNNLPIGVNTISITHTNGCSVTKDVIIQEFIPIQLNLTLVNDNQIVASASGGSEYYEFSLDSENGPWFTNSVFNNVPIGNHRVYVKDLMLEGCEGKYAEIYVFGYPKYFTPNGDGFHDTWTVYRDDLSNLIPNSVIYIYDRYGKLLKQLDPTTPYGWDGTFNGKPLPTSGYWFVLEYDNLINDGNGERKTLMAYFSLKR